MDVIDLYSQGLAVAIRIAAVPMIVMTCVGIFVALFQALTQLQEQTIQFFAKVAAFVVVVMLLGPWGGAEVVRLAINALDFARIAGR